jgi:hypothetical protein
MCIFAAAGIGAGLSALTTVASMGIGIMQAMAQQSAANAQYQQQLQYRKDQEVQAQKTLNAQVAQQSASLESQKDKAQGAKADAAIQTYAAMSRASTGSAEAGVVGLSVDNLLGAVQGEGGRTQNRIDYNSKVAQYNTENELKIAQRGGTARLHEIPIPVKPANTFGIDALSSVVSGLGQLAKLPSFNA